MPVAQGIRKLTIFKRQAGLGVMATGTGGQIMRRRTFIPTATRETFENDEIVSHHQSTGISYGLKRAAARLEGLLSPGTYSQPIESLLERNFVAGVSAAGASITVAGSGPTWTLTRAAGSYLTDGFKIGDVVRLTAGAFNASNINKNLWIVGLTATVATVRTLNETNLVAEGPIASATIAVTGKKTYAPESAHTDHYYTVEDWYSDLSRSEVIQDLRIGEVAVAMPASGNSTIGIGLVGLKRTLAGAQVLTTPTAETTTPVLSSVNGALLINGILQAVVTGINFSIVNGAADMGPVVGVNVSPDVQRGRIRVSGQFTALFDSATIQTAYDAETAIAIHSVITENDDAAARFIRFSLGRVKLTGDAPDDGEKGIVRTYPFTAEINGAGGAALADDKTIISVQDSDVP